MAFSATIEIHSTRLWNVSQNMRLFCGLIVNHYPKCFPTHKRCPCCLGAIREYHISSDNRGQMWTVIQVRNLQDLGRPPPGFPAFDAEEGFAVEDDAACEPAPAINASAMVPRHTRGPAAATMNSRTPNSKT